MEINRNKRHSAPAVGYRATSNTNLSDRAVEDYEIVQRAVQYQEERAYAELMSRYKEAIFNMMLKMVHNREDADDLTLEAFGKAFSKLATYTPRYAFSTWLFKIAINNCIDFIRKKKLNMLSIDDPIEMDSNQNYSNNLRSGNLDPEEKYIRDQKLMLMRSYLRQLNPKYRLMIELRFFEELTYDEIARELEIPLGTVKAQLFRAKELLTALMEHSHRRGHL